MHFHDLFHSGKFYTVKKCFCYFILFLKIFVVLGVCNTDNFSLLSITIDYSPFGFMEAYNPGVYDLYVYINTLFTSLF